LLSTSFYISENFYDSWVPQFAANMSHIEKAKKLPKTLNVENILSKTLQLQLLTQVLV
jgi:hypothetical protein